MIIPAVAVAILAGGASAQPRDTVRADADPGSRVWIEGSSNVHDWSCRATAFDARVELGRSSASRVGEPEATAELIRRVRVKLSARDLKCGNRKMESDLYRALGANDPARPSDIIGSFNAVPGGANGAIETQGTLTVAGVEKYVDVRITTELLPDGSVKARGNVPLLMTDFGVKPPVGLFGLIRSRNEVVVKFELIVAAGR